MSKDKQITVREAKAIEPEIDVYKFNRAFMYIIIIKPQTIIGGSGMNRDSAMKLKDMLNSMGVRAAFLIDDGDGFKMYECVPEK